MDINSKYDHPHRLHLETTKRCNLLCEHCYVSASDHFQDHDINLLRKVMLETKKNGASRITFTGGEFLIRKDHKELIRYAIDIGYRNIYFITNGIYLNKKNLSWLANLKVVETIKSIIPTLFNKSDPLTIGLGISIDGLKGNEIIRKHKNSTPVNHEKLLKTIELATQYGLYVTVNTTICNSTTASELFKLYNILLDLEIDRWQVDQVFMSGRSSESKSVESKEKWIDIAKESYYNIIKDYISKYPIKTKMKLEIVQVFRSAILEQGFKIIHNDNHHPCEYQFGSVIVENGSMVRFCPSLRYIGDEIFNIESKEISSKTYLESGEFNSFSKITLNDLPCKHCRYKYIAHGGCRGNSVSYNNRIYSKDPVCCAFAPFIESRIVPLMNKSLQKQYDDALFKEGVLPENIL